MATTTNYGWVTPDDTNLVKDGAAAIRTLGSSIDTTTKNLNPSTTLGDIEYRSATANTNTRLAIGSTGNVLTVSGGVPVWAAPAGGGKVLQVVSATYATATSTSGTSFVDSGLTATITPTLATSKVLVLVHHSIQRGSGNSSNSMDIQLLRDATQILLQSFLMSTNTTLTQIMMHSTNYLDSPATTSATTYKTQFKNNVAAASVTINANNDTSSITLLEIGV